MSRSNRMFEIIQVLRRARQPMTASRIAQLLEVTPRTIYRDIGALQSMRVPIEGEAGIGYVMRAGYDLPPMMFAAEEVEAIVVGLALLRRTGDTGLLAAANSVSLKLADVLPGDLRQELDDWPLHVSTWGVAAPSGIELGLVRQAIRDEVELKLVYEDAEGQRTQRLIKPLAMMYFVEVVVLAAWCGLRQAFRHFRADRMISCEVSGDSFRGDGQKLRALWSLEHKMP